METPGGSVLQMHHFMFGRLSDRENQQSCDTTCVRVYMYLCRFVCMHVRRYECMYVLEVVF